MGSYVVYVCYFRNILDSSFGEAVFLYSSTSEIIIFILIMVFFCVIMKIIENVYKYSTPIPFPMPTSLLYVCIGGLLARVDISKKKFFFGIILLCSSTLVFLISLKWEDAKVFCPALILVSTVCIYFIVYRLFNNSIHSTPSWICALSNCAFGVYLIHPLFINLTIKIFHINPLYFCPVVSISITAVFIFVISFLVTHILRKIHMIKKYVL